MPKNSHRRSPGTNYIFSTESTVTVSKIKRNLLQKARIQKIGLVFRMIPNHVLFSPASCPTLCSGNGLYLRGQCQCYDGWKGLECDLRADECVVPNCNGNGRCIDGTCICHPGFQGIDCGAGMMYSVAEVSSVCRSHVQYGSVL